MPSKAPKCFNINRQETSTTTVSHRVHLCRADTIASHRATVLRHTSLMKIITATIIASLWCIKPRLATNRGASFRWVDKWISFDPHLRIPSCSRVLLRSTTRRRLSGSLLFAQVIAIANEFKWGAIVLLLHASHYGGQQQQQLARGVGSPKCR